MSHTLTSIFHPERGKPLVKEPRAAGERKIEVQKELFKLMLNCSSSIKKSFATICQEQKRIMYGIEYFFGKRTPSHHGVMSCGSYVFLSKGPGSWTDKI